jgi:hypothetical protein
LQFDAGGKPAAGTYDIFVRRNIFVALHQKQWYIGFIARLAPPLGTPFGGEF